MTSREQFLNLSSWTTPTLPLIPRCIEFLSIPWKQTDHRYLPMVCKMNMLTLSFLNSKWCLQVSDFLVNSSMPSSISMQQLRWAPSSELLWHSFKNHTQSSTGLKTEPWWKPALPDIHYLIDHSLSCGPWETWPRLLSRTTPQSLTHALHENGISGSPSRHIICYLTRSLPYSIAVSRHDPLASDICSSLI